MAEPKNQAWLIGSPEVCPGGGYVIPTLGILEFILTSGHLSAGGRWSAVLTDALKMLFGLFVQRHTDADTNWIEMKLTGERVLLQQSAAIPERSSGSRFVLWTLHLPGHTCFDRQNGVTGHQRPSLGTCE